MVTITVFTDDMHAQDPDFKPIHPMAKRMLEQEPYASRIRLEVVSYESGDPMATYHRIDRPTFLATDEFDNVLVRLEGNIIPPQYREIFDALMDH